jgi:hypothetical protein
MILDVLGVLIAFVVIILLLSIIVTSLVQLTQASLRLRGRNLQSGLAALLRIASPTGQSEPRAPSKQQARGGAAHILNQIEAGKLSPVSDPMSWWNRAKGPEVSWIDQDILLRSAKAGGVPLAEVQVREHFPVLEAAMQKRFLLWMRIAAALWALVIAVLFQLNSPVYLRMLWENPELRERIASQAERVEAQAGEVVGRFHDYEASAQQALEELAQKYPDAAERIEQASGVGVNREYILQELGLALEGHPQRQQIVDEYAARLDDLVNNSIDAASTAAVQAGQDLRKFDVVPWAYGSSFYYKGGFEWRNIAGVLLTAILLTLGAPFWFNVLRNLVNLRDSLAAFSKDVTRVSVNERSVAITNEARG